MKNHLLLGFCGLLVACLGDGGDGVTNELPRTSPQLIFSTYVGGSTPCDRCKAADVNTFVLNSASDGDGNTYVTGATQVKDLPVKNARQSQPAAGSLKSAFVIKLDATGQILWATYFGGNNQTVGIGIVAMPGGGVAIAGLTSSDSGNPLPTKNAYQAAYHGGLSDYFVAVFDSDGNLEYSTYLGGSAAEGEAPSQFDDNTSNGNNLAVDSSGLLYVTGTTASGNVTLSFPLTPNAVQPKFGGMTDAFLAIIDPGKTGSASLLYSSFIGGELVENGHAITVNKSGSTIAVVGYTDSTKFPATANGLRSTPPKSGSNGFVAQLSSSLPGNPSSQYTVPYATYLGASSSQARDDSYAVAQDPAGLIVITGRTQSADFPMLPSSRASIYNSAPYLGQGSSDDEPYLVKLDTSATGADSLVYATFLGGGNGGAFCTAVAVGNSGASYVVGETSAPGILYQYSGVPQEAPTATPYTADALSTANNGSPDVLLMQVSADGGTLSYSTFLGTPQNDRGYGVAVDPSGNVVVSGLTYSDNFPLKNQAQNWPGNTGGANGFVTKFGGLTE